MQTDEGLRNDTLRWRQEMVVGGVAVMQSLRTVKSPSLT